jgi:hypothetical protein
MEKIVCKDCRYYLPVDVFKGICKLSKQMIGPDDMGCDQAERQAKCKFCQHYTPEKEYLGKCRGTALAYPDLNAGKCADFLWITQN